MTRPFIFMRLQRVASRACDIMNATCVNVCTMYVVILVFYQQQKSDALKYIKLYIQLYFFSIKRKTKIFLIHASCAKFALRRVAQSLTRNKTSTDECRSAKVLGQIRMYIKL